MLRSIYAFLVCISLAVSAATQPLEQVVLEGGDDAANIVKDKAHKVQKAYAVPLQAIF
jgi:hypothetical protein